MGWGALEEAGADGACLARARGAGLLLEDTVLRTVTPLEGEGGDLVDWLREEVSDAGIVLSSAALEFVTLSCMPELQM